MENFHLQSKQGIMCQEIKTTPDQFAVRVWFRKASSVAKSAPLLKVADFSLGLDASADLNLLVLGP